MQDFRLQVWIFLTKPFDHLRMRGLKKVYLFYPTLLKSLRLKKKLKLFNNKVEEGL